MDFSEKYIKMCEKVPQIQKKWKPEVRDVVYLTSLKKITFIVDKCFYKRYRLWGYSDFASKEDIIWIFTQDQLQGMVKDELSLTYSEFFNFIKSVFKKLPPCLERGCSGHYLYNWQVFDSLEQLWLAFVMYKKYGKIWNNKKEEWIKKEGNE